MSTISAPRSIEPAAEAIPGAPPDRRTASPLDHPHLLTLGRYNCMVETGVFHEKDPVYLWKGRLIQKMTKGRPHVVAQINLAHRMHRLVPDGWHVEQDQPMTLGDHSAPEPDLIVVRGTVNDYKQVAPSAQDVALVAEVSHSSLAEDLGDVLETYAAESIPVFWVVNLVDPRIEVRAEPTGPAERPSYRNIQVFGPGDEVPVVLDGREVGRIAVNDILP